MSQKNPVQYDPRTIVKEEGFIKKTITLYVSTRIGDNWKNDDDCTFKELKNGDYVVEERIKEK